VAPARCKGYKQRSGTPSHPFTGIRPAAGIMNPPERFDELPLDPRIIEGIHDMGFETMTPIQREAIPVLLTGADMIGVAQTGTGKTAAFLIPILQRLISKSREVNRALVLSPTRELALQIDEQMAGLSYHTGMTSVFIVGGMPFGSQERGIRAGSDVLIGTPGRILEHMKYDHMDMSSVEVVVLDESDRMLDLGFMPDVRRILHSVSPTRQMLMFSATMGKEIRAIAQEFLKDPEEIAVGHQRPVEAVRQRIVEVPQNQKEQAILALCRGEEIDSAIIFLRTKLGVARLARSLNNRGVRCESIHGDRNQTERNAALEAFRRKKVRILVATDVAARGLDISRISHVINYDIPQSPHDYIHRVGRTARAEATGDAITLVTPQDREALERIEGVVGFEIPRYKLDRSLPSESRTQHRNARGRRRS
jgi:ATP-dependent RNA helicase RhlE